MDGRHPLTAALWLAFVVVLGVAVVRGGPWLWPRLFPAPGPGSEVITPPDLPSAVLVAEVVHRTVATLGPPGDPGNEDAIVLPPGATGAQLQAALRADERLAGAEIYVTRSDDLLQRLRVFSGGQLLLQRDVRPTLPERPVISGTDPPELGFVFVFRERDDAGVQAVGRWKSPLAIGLQPFAPHSVKSARQASWSSKEVVLVVDPGHDLNEQLVAFPDASAALLEGALPDGTDPSAWVAPLAERQLALIDGRDGPPGELRDAAAGAGVSYVRRAGHLSDAESAIWIRNRAVRRGYGIVTVDATAQGRATAEQFIEEARTDGCPIAFIAEVARMHGGGGDATGAPAPPSR